jgi:small subunit ribosomal protein S14
MPKLSQKLRDERRLALERKYAPKRAELRTRLADPSLPMEEKAAIQAAFARLPRNSCPTRRTRRCQVSGRARGVYRKFGLSRIMLREMALRGELPGVRKSSW